MILDYVIVGVVVAAAVVYLGWTFRPKRSKRAAPSCSGCAHPAVPKAVPVRTRWTG